MSDPLFDPRFSKEGCGGWGGVHAAASDGVSPCVGHNQVQYSRSRGDIPS